MAERGEPAKMRAAPVVGKVSALVFLAALGAPARAMANPFGYHEHDGFYLRLAGGLASLAVERSTTEQGVQSSVAYGGEGSRVAGASVFSELSIGGTPFRGVVIAGSLLVDGLPAAEIQLANGSRFALGGPLVFAMLAPTVDVFPDPVGGFHVSGGAGLATSTAGIKDPIFNTIGGLGVGVTAAVGYDFWIGDDWGVGVLGRGMVARVQGEQQAGQAVGREHDTITCVSLAAALLYH